MNTHGHLGGSFRLVALVGVLGLLGAACGSSSSTPDAPAGSVSLSKIADQTIDEDTSTMALTFTVSIAAATVTAESSNTTLFPASGIVVGGSGTSRTVTLTPAKNANGTATITLTARSGSSTGTTMFSVTVKAVNDPPTIGDIADRSTEEGIALAAIPFTVGDVDNDPGTLTVTATSNNLALVPANGLVLGGSGANRTLTVTPAAMGTGSAVITVKVSDGSLDVSKMFTVTVTRSNNVNDPPVNKVPAGQKTLEDTPLVFSTANGNELSISDPDAGNSPMKVTLAVAGGVGTLTLASTTGLSFLAGHGSGDVSMTFTGTISAVNAALNGLTVTPPANFNGSGSLTITTNDQGASGTGGPQQDVDTVQVDVIAVDDPPTIKGITDKTIMEDGTTGPLAFIIGDPDTKIADLVVTRDSSNPAVIPLAGVVLGGSGVNRTVTVTPAHNAFGSSVITLAVSDGTTVVSTTFTVTVTPVEDAPTISNIPDDSMNAGQTKEVDFVVDDAETAAADLKVTFTQSGGPSLTISVGGSGADRSLSIMAPSGQDGTVTITVTVTDGAGLTASDMFVMTVNNINDPPVVTVPGPQSLQSDGGGTGTGSIAFTSANPITVDDPDSGNANISLHLVATNGITTTGTLPNGVTRSAGADASADQTLSGPVDLLTKAIDGLLFTSKPGFAGTATLTVTADDGGNSGTGGPKTDSKMVTIHVNTRPTITAIADKTIDEDTSTGALAFTINDFEQGTAGLTVNATSTNAALVPASALTLGGSAGARTVSATPLADQSGTTKITVTVADSDGGTRSVTFTLTVTPVDDAPVITAPDSAMTTEDVALFFNGNLSVFDVDNAVLDAVTLSATHGTLTLGSTVGLTFSAGTGTDDTTMTFSGALTDINAALDGMAFTPDPDFNGDAEVSMVADDGMLMDTANVPVTVVAANDPPVISSDDTLTTLNLNTDRTVHLSVSDVDVTPSQKVELTLAVDGGATLALPVHAGLTFSTGTGTGGETGVKFQGTLAAVNAALAADAGGVKITPMTSASGDVTLTATVNDLGNTGNDGAKTATMTWVTTYAAANTAPTITAISSASINEDQPGGHTAAFTVGDGQTEAGNLLVTAAATPNASDPVVVTLTVGGSGANRTVTAVPAANDHGKTTIAVTVSDGVLTKVETYILTVNSVNDAPVIAPATIADITFDEDGSYDLNFQATDVDGTFPTMAISSDNTGLLPNAAFTGLTTTHVKITPLPNQNGKATVTLTASDGMLVDTRTFTVNVRAVNDPPVISGTYPKLTVSDVEVGTGTYKVTIDVTGGTVTLVTVADLTFAAGDGDLDSHMVFQGSQAAVNAALNGVIDSVTDGKVVITVSDLGVSPSTDALPEGLATLCVPKGTGTCP
jgi:hypothetical protein